MATLLYITAHPLTSTESFSLAVSEAFLETYRRARPEDEIVPLDLFKMELPLIDADVLHGWGKLRAGSAFDQLTAGEQHKVGRISQLTDQFVAADRYVFVAPMWNFGLPPLMKAYIDTISIAGKTFRYTEQGPVGLLTDKMAVLIRARGGVYSEGPAAEMDFGYRYMETVMRFLGVPSFEAIFAEGHAAFPDRAGQIKAEAIERAREMARRWASIPNPTAR